MKRRPRTQSCPVCGSVMVYERRDDVLEYKGHQRTIKTLGFWCTNCGEGILTGKPLVASENAFLALKAEVDALELQAQSPEIGEALPQSTILAPNEVANVRKKLRLSQRKASELLIGGPDAFQKYESGKMAVTVSISNLLRLLDNDPKRLEELTKPALVKAPRLVVADPNRQSLAKTVLEAQPSASDSRNLRRESVSDPLPKTHNRRTGTEPSH